LIEEGVGEHAHKLQGSGGVFLLAFTAMLLEIGVGVEVVEAVGWWAASAAMWLAMARRTRAAASVVRAGRDCAEAPAEDRSSKAAHAKGNGKARRGLEWGGRTIVLL
jgi:hypothetical protein